MIDAKQLAEMLNDGRAEIRSVSAECCSVRVKPKPQTAGEKIADVMVSLCVSQNKDQPNSVAINEYADDPEGWQFIPIDNEPLGGAVEDVRRYIAAAIDKAIADEREACAVEAFSRGYVGVAEAIRARANQ